MTLQVRWPDTLVVEMAERRCIPFLGAGVSAACDSAAVPGKRPPTWRELLSGAAGLLPDAADKDAALQLLSKDQYLDAAQVIVDKTNVADFGQYIRSELKQPRYKPSRIHEAVLQLDPKVVITTNYDDVYETYCREGRAAEGYNVCRYYERHAIDDIRSDQRVILKAHGCVADPTQIVLCRSHYFEAKRNYPGFYSVLDALFLTNTLLFLGCGLSDPDIQLVLENVNISAPSSHPHYALVPAGKHRSWVDAVKKSFNIELLEYPVKSDNDHSAALDALQDLQERVLEERKP